jgi:hypothetical protein
MKFRATLQLNGKTATGFEVPPAVVEKLGTSKRPAVLVAINGHTYRSTVAVMGGNFMLGVSAENREAAGVAAGDTVDVDLELDTAPRAVTVPDDFAKALGRVPVARRNFDQLSYSKQQRHVLPIEQAKTAETRRRRIAKSVDELRSG